jgi:catechol 2,3-dioxygenase-like lactoylglutathione lyase family enzyme
MPLPIERPGRVSTPFLTTNTILYCRRFDETAGFYSRRLELPVTFRCDWLVEFRTSADARLSVADERRARVKSAEGAGITITLQVADVDRTRAWLRARGVVVSAPVSHPWGARLCRFHDPEGHRLEIWSPVGGRAPQSSSPASSPDVKP